MKLRDCFLADQIIELQTFALSKNLRFVADPEYNHRKGREEYLVSICDRDGVVITYWPFYVTNTQIDSEGLYIKSLFVETITAYINRLDSHAIV
jgi:hypothetical protein